MLAEESMSKIEIECRLFDTCHSDYVTDWSGIVVGVALAGQDRDEMADEVARDASYDAIENQDILDQITDDMVRAAVVACLRADARFWPVDDSATEIHTTDLDDPRLQQDQPSAWFRLIVLADGEVVS